MAKEPTPKTALVLSGGASLGAIQIGMLRALYERDVAPDLIVGSSVGALNGAFIASRPATPQTAEALTDVWRGIGRWQVFPLSPFTGFFGFFGARDHLISDRGLRSLVEKEIEFATLERARTPFHVIATDLLSGREVRLSSGNALEAVLASSAIPGLFPPVDWNGRKLIDGGISNNTPISSAIELGAERIYVLPTGYACELADAPRGAVGTLLHAVSLVIMRRLLIEVETFRDEAELIILPPPCPLAVTPLDFSHTDELIDRAYAASAEYLDAVDAGMPPVPLPPRIDGDPARPVAA